MFLGDARQSVSNSNSGKRAAGAVLYFLHCGNLFGTERMALATLDGMTEYAHRVVFAPWAATSGGVILAARGRGFDAEVCQTTWQFTWAVLRWLLRNRSVDVISTGVKYSLITLVLGRLLFVRVRHLHVTHGGTSESHAYGRKRVLNRLPIRIIAVSEFVRSRLVAHGTAPARIDVIENFLIGGAPSTSVRRADYVACPIAPAEVRVAVVSRLDVIKRVDVLIDALEIGGLDDFRIDVYGEGSEADTLRSRSARLPNVRFWGVVPDVDARLAKADVLVHLCPEEPFGLVILEAFRAGVVVVVPNAGGAGDLVEDGVTGYKFEANDPSSVVAAMQRVRNAPNSELQALVDAASQELACRFAPTEGIQRYRQAFASS